MQINCPHKTVQIDGNYTHNSVIYSRFYLCVCVHFIFYNNNNNNEKWINAIKHEC
jgi:hypothetical protein